MSLFNFGKITASGPETFEWDAWVN